MKITVMGMGYVGCVTAAVFSREGNQVVGIDTNPAKVEALARGECPIVEPGLPELIREGHASGRLRCTADPAAALATSDLVVICVGTPSYANGGIDTSALLNVSRQIGAALAPRRDFPVVVLRSTLLPEVLESVVLPELLRAAGGDSETFGFAVNPEFLREGTAILDFDAPPFTLIGTADERVTTVLEKAYGFVDAPFVSTDIKTAGSVKYAANAFHALKVAFANEIETVSRAAGVDGVEVMRLLCLDDKLNISPAYLRPGMPFGGSCLPKDVRALAHYGRENELPIPLLRAVLRSNELRIEGIVERILTLGKRRIGVLGLSFKPGTDDLRESPSVAIVEALLDQGLQVAIYDPLVAPQHLLGANREYLTQHLPRFASLFRATLDEVLGESEVLVRTNGSDEFADVRERIRADQSLIDPVSGLDRIAGGGRVAARRARADSSALSG